MEHNTLKRGGGKLTKGAKKVFFDAPKTIIWKSIRAIVVALYLSLGTIGKTIQMALGTLVILFFNKLPTFKMVPELGGFSVQVWPWKRILLLYKCLPEKYKTVTVGTTVIRPNINGEITPNTPRWKREFLKCWLAIQAYEGSNMWHATDSDMIIKNISNIGTVINTNCQGARVKCDEKYDCHRNLA